MNRADLESIDRLAEAVDALAAQVSAVDAALGRRVLRAGESLRRVRFKLAASVDTMHLHHLFTQLVEGAGGVTNLSRALGLTRQGIYIWRRRGVPPNRVLDVERLTGVPRHIIRPDIYPPGGSLYPAREPQSGKAA